MGGCVCGWGGVGVGGWVGGGVCGWGGVCVGGGVGVCLSVRSFLPPRASRPRNIGTHVFTATQKTLL